MRKPILAEGQEEKARPAVKWASYERGKAKRKAKADINAPPKIVKTTKVQQGQLL